MVRNGLRYTSFLSGVSDISTYLRGIVLKTWRLWVRLLHTGLGVSYLPMEVSFQPLLIYSSPFIFFSPWYDISDVGHGVYRT